MRYWLGDWSARVYEPATMKIDIWRKDLGMISSLAIVPGVPTPTFIAISPIHAAAVCGVLESMRVVSR